MSDELDPTIAALLAEAGNDEPEAFSDAVDFTSSLDEMSDFSPLAEKEEPKRNSVAQVDLSITKFEPITKFFEDAPRDYFDDKAYYKTALTGEGDASQRVHQVLSKYLNCQDPKDRTVFRQQMVTAYWELLRSVAPKMADYNLPMPKRMMVRFGVLLPSLFTAEQKEMFSKSILENDTNEPVYYLDEWFKEITGGRLTLSATDETRPTRKSGGGGAEQQQLLMLKNKNDGKIQSAESLLTAKESERSMMEHELKARIDQICMHNALVGLAPHKESYTEAQKHAFVEIGERIRALQRNDKEIATYVRELQEARATGLSLEQKMKNAPTSVEVAHDDIMTEMNTVRQMAKMTIGRQGNQFPVFTREFFHCIPQGTGFRENVLNLMAWIESLDPGAYCRIHKNTPNRIVPYVLLVPTYGDFGFCWEPFDRYNRVTSRGRIVIPMYPRDLKIALLMAVADLRWQVAKEKASYYWMEEGLTGQYYQWVESQKLKGDLKSFFIADYVLWMTKEANGTQVMDKKLRAIFWRYIPFPQEKKDDLKKRSLVYAELCQRDANRAMSDGY